MTFRKRRSFIAAAHALLIAALVLASFAHTAFQPKISTPTGFDTRAYAAQYTLPDGSLPVPCDWTGDGHPHHPSAIPCDFCLIASGTALIVPDIKVTTGFSTVVLSNLLTSEVPSATRDIYRVFAPARAPPIA